MDSERAGDSPVRLPLCRLGKIRTMSGLITMVELTLLPVSFSYSLSCVSIASLSRLM